MPEADPRVAPLFAGVDRFLQWDLVTVTPWGAPSISPVGARLVPEEATIWTSTTVGYAAKVRNIRRQPRVALMRSYPGQPALLIRGEARVVAGDGTANLAQLFQLMGGAGGARRFFATSAADPFWSRLYRAYWRRFLIAVRIVDISTLGEGGWERLPVAAWSSAKAVSPRPLRRSPGPRRLNLLDPLGRALLEAGTPAAFATVRRRGSCPSIWPVSASIGAGGTISIEAGVPLPGGRLPHSSLAVRMIDDSFEVARMAAWIGTLEPGQGTRLLLPRARYGFAKPQGVLGDLAAGTAALAQSALQPQATQVSSPDLARALELGRGQPAPRLELTDAVWSLVEQLFARRNAAAAGYAALAALVPNSPLHEWLGLLAERAQLDRDWAQALLTRGAQRVGAVQLALGALALRPDPAAPLASLSREETRVRMLKARLVGQLPPGLTGPPLWPEGLDHPGLGSDVDGAEGGARAMAAAALAAATALAAALERWRERSPR